MASRPGPRPNAGGSELERIRATVSARFPVYETRVGPQSLLLAVHVNSATLEPTFDALRQELGAQGYLPLLRREFGEEFIEVVRKQRGSRSALWVNLVLLAATLATSIFAGALIWLAFVGASTLSLDDFANGTLYFALPLMAILGLHELAHYAFARRRHLDASLPFFLPVPPPLPFGTFGAFVSIREPFPDRKAMFDVSAAGPLVGFAASIPVSIGGLYLSEHVPIVPVTYCAPTILYLNYGHLIFSPSLLWSLFAAFFPASGTVLHPLALAGWVGILVTSINLLPIGSLDGGRVFRALLGERSRYVSYGAAFSLFALSIYYPGWFIFGVLVIFLGLRNPPPLNDLSSVGARRYAVGAVVAAVLIAGFVVVPIQIPMGSIGLGPQAVGPLTPSAPAVIGATLTVVVSNHDAVGHAFLFDLDVENVSVNGTGGTHYLSPVARAAWAASSNWTFELPQSVTVGPLAGGYASLPFSSYVYVPGHGAVTVSVEYTNTQSAVALLVGFTALEICPPTGGGSATTEFLVTPG